MILFAAKKNEIQITSEYRKTTNTYIINIMIND